MFPEALVCASCALPIGVHVGEKGVLARGGQDLSNVGVSTGGIAICIIRSIAVVWPRRCQLQF